MARWRCQRSGTAYQVWLSATSTCPRCPASACAWQSAPIRVPRTLPVFFVSGSLFPRRLSPRVGEHLLQVVVGGERDRGSWRAAVNGMRAPAGG